MSKDTNDQILNEFSIGTWMKLSKLRESFQFLVAMNAYKADDSSILLLRDNNRLMATQLYNGDYVFDCDPLEDIYSYFSCTEHKIEDPKAFSDFLKFCLETFFNLIIDENDEDFIVQKLQISSDLLQNSAKSGYWGDFITHQHLASRVFFDAFLNKVLENPDFEFPAENKGLSAREIATIFYYMNESKEYAENKVDPGAREWQFCVEKFGQASITNIRKRYNVIAHQQHVRLGSLNAYKIIEKIIDYLERNHPSLERTILLAKKELQDADKLR